MCHCIHTRRINHRDRSVPFYLFKSIQQVNIQIGEITTRRTNPTFFGMTFNHPSKTVTLADKTAKKVKEERTQLQKPTPARLENNSLYSGSPYSLRPCLTRHFHTPLLRFPRGFDAS